MPFFIMRILVLGASGMLGHKILSMPNPDFEIYGTCRTEADCGMRAPFFPFERLIPNVRAENFDNVAGAKENISPDTVINCIWIVKPLDIAKFPIPSICINSLFPHLPDEVCITIESDDDFKCGRSLDSSEFNKEAGYQSPGWQNMVDNIISDSELYGCFDRNVRT